MRGQVEGHRQPGLSGGKVAAIERIGFFGVEKPHTGEWSMGGWRTSSPDPARERCEAGQTPGHLETLKVLCGVERLDRIPQGSGGSAHQRAGPTQLGQRLPKGCGLDLATARAATCILRPVGWPAKNMPFGTRWSAMDTAHERSLCSVAASPGGEVPPGDGNYLISRTTPRGVRRIRSTAHTNPTMAVAAPT